jgi:hypothetical protein
LALTSETETETESKRKLEGTKIGTMLTKTAMTGNLAGSLWIFTSCYQNRVETVRVFRGKERCEAFAVAYLAPLYAYAVTGNVPHDLQKLSALWQGSSERDTWTIAECIIE